MSPKRGGKSGAVVHVSLVAALTDSPGEYVDYAASKDALDALTRGLAKEVANEGICVSSVRPEFIYTDMHVEGGEPDRVQRLNELLPMKRSGTPSEIAKPIVWLLSEDASYVTAVLSMPQEVVELAN